MTDLNYLSDLTRTLMNEFGIPIRSNDPNAGTVTVRAEYQVEKPAAFSSGEGFYSYERNGKLIVTGYAHPTVKLSYDAHKILFEMKNALKAKYYESILVHELVHFWEVRSLDPMTLDDGYIPQSAGLDLYMNQECEVNAYFIQALYYFGINKISELTEMPKKLINRLFIEEHVLYRYV